MLESVNKSVYTCSSGAYNVRSSERGTLPAVCITEELDCSSTIAYSVHFLDDTVVEFKLDKKHKGQAMLDRVVSYLNLSATKLFGLQYSLRESDAIVQRWLDPQKLLRRQCVSAGSEQPRVFRLRFRFYPENLGALADEQDRFLLCLQLRSDIATGLLTPLPKSLCLLASYVCQVELGDYDPKEQSEKDVRDMCDFCTLTDDMLDKVIKLHDCHRGMSPAEADIEFLEHAMRLEKYGVEQHHARDENDFDLLIGICKDGILVFRNSVKINTFSWSRVIKMVFKRKEFFIQIRSDNKSTNRSMIGFRLASHLAAKSLWRSAVDHHAFFRVKNVRAHGVWTCQTSGHAGGGESFGGIRGVDEEVTLRKRLTNVVNRVSMLDCGSSDSTLRKRVHQNRLSWCRRLPGEAPSNSLDSLQPTNTSLSGARARSAMGDWGASIRSRLGLPLSLNSLPRMPVRPFARQQNPRIAWSIEMLTKDSDKSACRPSSVVLVTDHTDGHRVTTVPPPGAEARNSYISPLPGAFAPDLHAPFMDDSEGSEASLPWLSPTYSNSQPSGMQAPSSGSVSPSCSSMLTVVLRADPDSDGCYGFNVTGGADQSCPLTVSKVAAAVAVEAGGETGQLREGDKIVAINGVDVTMFSHDEVVSLIKSSRQQKADLLLTLLPNAGYSAVCSESADGVEEPAIQYVPDCTSGTGSIGAGTPDNDPLVQSMYMLDEVLSSGAVVWEFDKLPRFSAELSMDEAMQPANIYKNRYRDISPYDCTRVVLEDSESGDYINASHVDIECPDSQNVNRFIACQGPLCETQADFWLMVWQQQSPMVIMLTSLVELGRVKCHQYWPDLGHHVTHGDISVECQLEVTNGPLCYRRLRLTHVKSEVSRYLMHVQYLRWPDHGVPPSCDEFVSFTDRVAAAIRGAGEAALLEGSSGGQAPLEGPTVSGPTVVHCSAGIGRTGVLLLMDTALQLMAVGLPVYPLQLMRSMREQRPMLVQTACQYRFVCDAILTVYRSRFSEAQKVRISSSNSSLSSSSSSASSSSTSSSSRLSSDEGTVQSQSRDNCELSDTQQQQQEKKEEEEGTGEAEKISITDVVQELVQQERGDRTTPANISDETNNGSENQNINQQNIHAKPAPSSGNDQTQSQIDNVPDSSGRRCEEIADDALMSSSSGEESGESDAPTPVLDEMKRKSADLQPSLSEGSGGSPSESSKRHCVDDDERHDHSH